jgi:hypothetical protein
MSGPSNPPAFPVAAPMNFEGLNEGMTLRDWFAGQALVSLGKHDISSSDYVAEHAYTLADAMLAHRERGQ